jgi:glycosyltransferase involved in cell wall biosynthesis
MPLPGDPRVVAVGPVSEGEKQDALAAADLLIQPSRFESLSIVLLEAWLAGLPVLVNGRCAVMKGQCRRSQGGLWYDGAEEFGEALTHLLESPALRQRMAANGARYVGMNYSWERVEGQYRDIVGQVRFGRNGTA